MSVKKIIVYVFIAIVSIISLRFILSFGVNNIVIKLYENEKYSEDVVQTLFPLNFIEPYIAYYNYGNILYKQENYENAIIQYKIALKRFPPKDKECKIRINLALAMLKLIDFDHMSKDEILEWLNAAEDILCEKGCASKDDVNFHNDEAQRLKDEIEKMKELLNNSSKSNDDTKTDEEDSKNTDDDLDINEEKKRNKEIEEKLNEMQKENQEDRNETMQRVGNMTKNSGYYKGKKW